MPIRLIPCSFLLALLCLATGCGENSDVVPVTGLVTLDDEPLSGVMIRFTPLEAEQRITSLGMTAADGSFQLRFDSQRQGALVGKHLVQVVRDPSAIDSDAPRPKRIPDHYSSGDSELTAEVTRGGSNHFEFALSSRKAR
ncbi:hypothetical protein [Blastopirellula marina]|uniref:Carboxypeptidase regulatory-like domain-containing protein n=1 Tax=Blastopirellula marina TaxID=124 RepID=A0A2S8GGB6_9BACT|nr:hypothetical protein [Blastopirellula marina]PQO43489.1 hypothetical protein C5Y93_22810 [Blastopirellula marina]